MMQTQPFEKHVWAEIDLEALRHNFRVVKARAGALPLCAVVKADSYGHGAVQCARVFAEEGAAWLAVSCLTEAVQLRKGGLTLPILVLGHVQPGYAAALIQNHITVACYSAAQAKALSDAAVAAGGRVQIHLKADTGMGRIGFALRTDFDAAIRDMLTACALPGLEMTGLFQHFSVADDVSEDNIAYTAEQHRLFVQAFHALKAAGQEPQLVHCDNSAGVMLHPDWPEGLPRERCMARPGIILYGYDPSDEVRFGQFQPVMTLIMIAVSVLTAAFPKLTEKRLQAHQENEQQAKARYLTAITQIFSGFFQLKIFNAFSGINHAHDEANETLYRKKLRSRRIRRILYAGAYGCGNLVVLGTWVLGLFFVTRGVITLPALITFAGLMNFVAGPVQIISERYSSTIAASAVCKRVLAFLDAPTDEADSWGSEPLTQIKTVTLNDISCRRDDREILKHVDLTLRKGDRVALLGESGAGKSTLLKVLASMYAAEGEYAINGRPCRDYRYEDFRRQVTLLSQKTFVYSASIRDNLTMFSGTAQQDEALTKTLADAGLSKWYAERGASMDTQIGGEEHALSGGEERRLDLARTLWRKGSLVMLDEPAAGMNPQESLELMHFIQHIRDEFDLTILLIEHDMKVVMGVCQYIWVMEYGALIAEGDPEAVRNNPVVIRAYLGEDVAVQHA